MTRQRDTATRPGRLLLGHVAFLCLQVACASEPKPVYRFFPLEGVEVAPWEQARAICKVALVEGKIDVAANEGNAAVQDAARARSQAEYESCMAHHGWVLRRVPPREAP